MDSRGNFEFFENQTDIVQATNSEYNKLTPEHRALTAAEVLKRCDLWSYRFKVKDAFEMIISGESTPALEVAGRYGNIVINNNDMVCEDVLKHFGELLNKQ